MLNRLIYDSYLSGLYLLKNLNLVVCEFVPVTAIRKDKILFTRISSSEFKFCE